MRTLATPACESGKLRLVGQCRTRPGAGRSSAAEAPQLPGGQQVFGFFQREVLFNLRPFDFTRACEGEAAVALFDGELEPVCKRAQMLFAVGLGHAVDMACLVHLVVGCKRALRHGVAS